MYTYEGIYIYIYIDIFFFTRKSVVYVARVCVFVFWGCTLFLLDVQGFWIWENKLRLSAQM